MQMLIILVSLCFILWLGSNFYTLPRNLGTLSSFKYDYFDVAEDAGSSTSECDILANITLDEFFSVVNISSDNVFMIWPLKPASYYRALCSIESWSTNHPNSSIWYVFTVNELQDQDGFLHRMLAQFPNFKLIYTDLQKLFENTPFSNNSLHMRLKESKWPGTQLSDLIRQALVWHKGGYYTDTDIYSLKSLYNFRNFIAVAKNHLLDPSLMHFDAHHPWVNAVMETILNTYTPSSYMSAGPRATTSTGKKLCGGQVGKWELHGNGSYRECTVNGQPLHTLSPLQNGQCGRDCLKPGKGEKFYKDVNLDWYSFHVGNSGTRKIPDPINSDSILQAMAKRNCPFTYTQAKERSNFW